MKVRSTVRDAALWAAPVFGLLAPAGAHAHVGHVIARAERYLKLEVAGNDARVVVSLTLGEGEGERVLSEADADRDGDPDLIAAAWGAGNGKPRLLLNDGRARFVEADDAFPDGPLFTMGMATGDLDGDGDRDVVVTSLDARARGPCR